MDWLTWYNGLVKPSWTPAPATIGLIWQILYPIILVTFGFVFVQMFRGKISWKIALPFAINLVANLIFTPIQFGMRNLPLAAVDILIVWGTIIWMMVAIWRHYRWIAFAQIPYFVWVSLATVLQLSITAMNLGTIMNHKLLALPLLILMGSFVTAEDIPQTLFDFNGTEASKEWQPVNDGVMGGVSEEKFKITDKQTLEFFGTLSLENNGGFASVRTKSKKLGLEQGDTLIAKVKGDGREYLACSPKADPGGMRV